MKTLVSGNVLGAVAAAAMLVPLAASPAAAQVPGGSYLQLCRDIQVRGDRLSATCRTREGSSNQTSLDNIDRCVGGISNYNGRLVCGTYGGGFNMGSGGDRDRQDDGRRADRDRRDDDQRADRDRREDNRRGDRDRQDDGQRADRDRQNDDRRGDRDWRDHGWRRDWGGYGSTNGPYVPVPGRDPWGRW
jgi:hypothetical protein